LKNLRCFFPPHDINICATSAGDKSPAIFGVFGGLANVLSSYVLAVKRELAHIFRPVKCAAKTPTKASRLIWKCQAKTPESARKKIE